MKSWKWSKKNQVGWLYFILDGEGPLVKGLHKETRHHADTGKISSGSPRRRHQDGINNAREFFFSCTFFSAVVTPEAVRAGGFILAHGSRRYSPSWWGKHARRRGRPVMLPTSAIMKHRVNRKWAWAIQPPPPEGSTTFPNRAASSGPTVETVEPLGKILCSNYNSKLLLKIWGQCKRKLLNPFLNINQEFQSDS